MRAIVPARTGCTMAWRLGQWDAPDNAPCSNSDGGDLAPAVLAFSGLAAIDEQRPPAGSEANSNRAHAAGRNEGLHGAERAVVGGIDRFGHVEHRDEARVTMLISFSRRRQGRAGVIANVGVARARIDDKGYRLAARRGVGDPVTLRITIGWDGGTEGAGIR